MTGVAPLRLLVIDDDEVDRRAVRRALRGAGDIVVTEAAEGPEAVEQLVSGAFDVALLDYHLAGWDGLTVLRMARTRGSEVPVVVLTGQGDDLVAVELMKAGAADYLTKASASGERLAHAIRQAVRLARAEAEARAARKASEQSQERLRLALEAASLGTWDYDPGSRVTILDARCKALFRLDPDAPVTLARARAAVHPDDLDALDRALEEAVDPERATVYDVEFRTHPDSGGSVRWLRAIGRAVFEHGRAIRLVGTIQDITDRKRREEEAARQAEFEQQLIGIVSHDLRNPLAAIAMNAAVLGTSPPEIALRASARIQRSVHRCLRMVSDLLDLTQARFTGTIAVNPVAADVHAIAAGAVEEMRSAEPNRAIVHERSGDGSGQWDPDRLSQVIGNLLRNAITYGAPDRPVTVRTRGEHDVLVEVHNHGTPIAPELRASLFEPFRRGTDRNPGERSVGLGLFIVRRLVDAHGGTVEVRSSAEEGTAFCVRLPRAENRSRSESPVPAPDRSEITQSGS